MSLRPKPVAKTCCVKQSEGLLVCRSVEAFCDAILLWGTGCGCLVGDAFGTEPGFEFVVDKLATSIRLDNLDLP